MADPPPTPTTIPDLLRDLLAAAPALWAIHAQHFAEYDGEVLPHLFVADVTRWLAAHGPDAPVLAALERHLVHGEPEVQNVVALSFVENLGPEDRALRAALGPALRAELHAQEAWTPADGPLSNRDDC